MSLLAATLAVNPGGALFYGLGIVTGVVWVAGSLFAGPLEWVRSKQPGALVLDTAVSRGLLVPIVLHVSWSTLMLFFLPR